MSGYVYFVTIATAVTCPLISPTKVKIPDSSRIFQVSRHPATSFRRLTDISVAAASGTCVSAANEDDFCLTSATPTTLLSQTLLA